MCESFSDNATGSESSLSSRAKSSRQTASMTSSRSLFATLDVSVANPVRRAFNVGVNTSRI